jgi:hypothetical protein
MAKPNAGVLTIAAGHIGVVAGGHARSILYEPLNLWLDQTLPKIK